MTVNKLLKMAFATALIFGVAGASLASDATPRKTEAAVNSFIAVGAEPLPFTLKRLGGDPVELKPLLTQKAVMLVFWSLFCGPCQEELPLVDQIFKKYSAQGLEVFAVNLDGEKRSKAVDTYMKKQGFSFSVLWEVLEGVSYLTADSYGVAGTPTLVLIGKSGKVSFTHVGKTGEADLENAVQAALAEK